MLPATISRKLSAVRTGEAVLRLLWGVARWVAVVLIVLGVACLTDWAIDRHYETPWPLRIAMFVGQIALGLYIAYRWLVRPLAFRMSQADMALLVEEKTPVLRHRLISVVQFQQPNPHTEGMSEELIVRVTEETVRQTGGMSFTRALDRRRVGWSLGTFVPILILVVVSLVLCPELMGVLLLRQLLLDVPIPRSVHLVSENRAVEPKGEEVVLRFRVSGDGWTPASIGQVRIDPEGQPSMYFDLEHEETLDSGEAIFVTPPKTKRESVKLPTIANFTYRAWLADGRTAHASEMRFEARPVIDSQNIRAWVLLPDYCPKRPSGLPYEIDQQRGDIVALLGASARVRIKVQKSIKKAVLHLLGPVALDSNPTVLVSRLGLGTGGAGLGPLSAAGLPYVLSSNPTVQQQLIGSETKLGEIPMELLGDHDEAEAEFVLPATATGYRLIVEDEYGFANLLPPRRSIRMVTEEPPQVAMLPMIFDAGVGVGSAEDFPMDGLPIPPKGKLRIAYACSAPFGIGGAKLHFRVIKQKKVKDGDSTEPVPGQWEKLDLYPVHASDKSGPFLPNRGIFANSSDLEQIPFHAVPSPDPEMILGRKIGGGRWDFKTATMLRDHRGKLIPLKPGDQIEYKIEVFPAGPDGKADTMSGRKSGFSETRKVSVVSLKEWGERLALYEQEVAKVRKLQGDQGKVFPR
jgi:hypothetical protein